MHQLKTQRLNPKAIKKTHVSCSRLLMFAGSSADNVASEFISRYNCANCDYYDRGALGTQQNHSIAFPGTEYEILMCRDLFLELDTQRGRGVMAGDNWKPWK